MNQNEAEQGSRRSSPEGRDSPGANVKTLPISTAPELVDLFARLLDREHMFGVFRRLLPAWTDASVRLDDCQPKARFHRGFVRDNRLYVTYRLELAVASAAPQTFLLTGVAPVSAEFFDAGLLARASALREHPWVAPFRDLTPHVADLRLALLVFPLDPGLPGLADLIGRDGARLLADCLPEPWHSARLEPLRSEIRHYTPSDRAVVRVTTRRADEAAGEETFYVKVFDDDRSALCHRHLAALSSATQASRALRVPQPLGYDAERHLFVMSEVPGERHLNEWIKRIEKAKPLPAGVDLARVERCIEVSVKALHELQQVEVLPCVTRSFRDELAQLDKDRAVLRALRPRQPELVALAEELLQRLEALAPAREQYVPAHGAFRHKQMIGDEHNLSIIDWDGFCLASPALDPATFLGRLRREHVLAPGRAPELERIAVAFRRGFLAHRPSLADRLALYEALVLVEQMLRTFRRAGDDRESSEHIRRFAGEVEQLLDQAQSSEREGP